MSTRLLSTPEAAAALGITVARVQQLIWNGRLHAQKVGRDYVIQESDLDSVRERPTGRPPKLKSNGAGRKKGGKK